MLQALVKFKPETEEKIYNYERVISFSIALLTTLCLLSYKVTNDVYILKVLPYIIFVYIFLDLSIAKGSTILHHIFSLNCCYNNIKYFVNDTYHLHFIPLFNTEITTVFLIIKLWMDGYTGKKNALFNVLSGINEFLFLSLFFKFRIYDYYNLLQNSETYTIINHYTSYNLITNTTAYIGLYGLYFINIYWFSIICKKLYKQIIIKFVPFINTDRFAEYVLTFTFYINFYIAYLRYFMNFNNYHYFDLFGIFVLSIASGNYHYSKYRYLKHNSVINITSNELLEPFIYDKYAIHLRSFLALTTLSLIRSTSQKFIFFSIGYHGISLASLNMNIIKTLFTNNKIVYDETENSKKISKKIEALASIPCLIDTIMIICYHTNKYELKSELIIISVAVGLILSVNPFYNLNHVLLHLFLILQTNCISNYALQ